MVEIPVELTEAGARVWAAYQRQVPETHNLTIRAFAGGSEVSVEVQLDGERHTTPATVTKSAGSYILTVPDSIQIGGSVYNLERWEER